MAKKPKYFTISDEQAEKLRAGRATGGKAKVTAPKYYDPGKGRPKEQLAYLNKGEMKTLRSMNGNNMERGPKGLPSFADDSASSKGVSRGGQGAVGSNKGGGGGGKGPSGGMMGGTGSGGSARTTPSRGADVGAGRQGGSGGSRSGPGSTGGSKTPSASKPSAPSQPKSTGPSRGPTGGPVRTEPSRALGNVAPAGSKFGPRAGVDRTAGTITPSTIAADRVMNQIAQGSSVLGSTVPKMQDRVPADPTKLGGSQIVNMDQRPTITSGPPVRGGLGQISPPAKTRGLEPASGPTEDIFAGANSPFADSGVSQYNRDTYGQMPPSRAFAQGYGDYRTPPSPYSPAAQDVRDRIAAVSDPSGLPMPAGSALASAPMPRAVASVQPSYPSLGPVADPRSGFLAQNNVWTGSPAAVANLGLGAVPARPAFAAGTDIYGNQYRTAGAPVQATKPIQDRISSDPSLIASSSPVVADPSGRTDIFRQPQNFTNAFNAGADLYADQYRTAGAPVAKAKTQDRIVNIGGVSRELSPDYMSQMDPQDQAALNAAFAANQVPTYNPPPAGLTGSVTAVPVGGEQTAAQAQVANAPVEKMPPSNAVGQKIADKFADYLNTRVAPSQQDSWLERADNYLTDKFGTPGPNSPYARQQARLNDVAGRGDSGLPQPAPPPAPVVAAPLPPPPPPMPQLPPYVNYQQLPTTYTGGVSPSQPITDYIYGGYASGGSVSPRNWDRIDAAIRLAKLFS